MNKNWVKELDRKRILEEKKFEEFPIDKSTYLFYFPGKTNVWIAQGFNRIEFGDHGPYVEFEREHLVPDLFDQFSKKPFPKQNLSYFLSNPRYKKCFYLGCYPEKLPSLKIYYQLRGVEGLRNAPPRRDGLPSTFNREGGYAKYIPGKFYIAADLLTQIKLQ